MGPSAITETQATTILAFKFADGVLVAGDRGATAGNVVMYDRADKVLEIDRHSLVAIAGSWATAWEMARVLDHSFQYYRRSQLQEMSVEGKVGALSKLLRDHELAGRRARVHSSHRLFAISYSLSAVDVRDNTGNI
jgi:proteasome beta subunit